MTAKFEQQFGPLLEGMSDMFNLDDDREGRPATDIEAIYEVEHKLQEFDRRGREVVDVARDDLKQLATAYKQTQLNNARTTGGPTSAEHEASMAAAQQALLAGLKTNKSKESNLYRLQAELARLQQENREEEEQEDIKPEELNSEVIRLKIYRDIGFTPKEEDGIITQVLVRSQTSHNVQTISVDSSAQPFFWSNYLWDALAA